VISGSPQLIHAAEHDIPRQVGINLAAVVGVRGDDELPRANTQQVVLSQQPVNPLRIHRPSSPSQLGSDARPAVTGPFQRNPLDGITQTLGLWCHGAGLGDEPRKIFAGLEQISLVDVVLPTRAGIAIDGDKQLDTGSRKRSTLREI
jgi:hypothetical protein